MTTLLFFDVLILFVYKFTDGILASIAVFGLEMVLKEIII